jgi:hypothetical protein
MLGNLKNSLAGTYHAIRDKHVPRYLEQFLDEHRATYGVEPICKVLPIAPSTYHAHNSRDDAQPAERQFCTNVQEFKSVKVCSDNLALLWQFQGDEGSHRLFHSQ